MDEVPGPDSSTHGSASSLVRLADVGLYIVTLNNEHPIPVNANDRRRADTCIRVSRVNCKFGKATSLSRRRENYCKVFGAANVNFRPIALTEQISRAEKLVLAVLEAWRIRGLSGRKNEWLFGIEPAEVERIALSTLNAAGFEFALPGRSENQR